MGGTQPQTALLGPWKRFCFRTWLGTWIPLSQQALAAIIPQLLPFAVTYGLLSCTPFVLLLTHLYPCSELRAVSSPSFGHLLALLWNPPEWKEERSLLPQAVQNASKHVQNTANSSLTGITVLLLSQNQTQTLHLIEFATPRCLARFAFWKLVCIVVVKMLPSSIKAVVWLLIKVRGDPHTVMHSIYLAEIT